MALVLIKEDGTVVAGANSYASAADGDAYHDGHLYASKWTAATTAQKEAALVMATRLIDAYVQFNGRKATDSQALQWPRAGCPDVDAPSRGLVLRFLGSVTAGCIDPTVVPAGVVAATCEEARLLLGGDLSVAPMGQGLKSSHVGDSVLVFDVLRPPPVLGRVAAAMLGKFGVVLRDGGQFVVNLGRA